MTAAALAVFPQAPGAAAGALLFYLSDNFTIVAAVLVNRLLHTVKRGNKFGFAWILRRKGSGIPQQKIR